MTTIKFKKAIELEVVISYDEETETGQTELETFVPGNITQAEVIDTDDNRLTATLQFGDGSVAFNVPMDFFEVATEDSLVSKEKAPFDDPLEYHQSFS